MRNKMKNLIDTERAAQYSRHRAAAKIPATGGGEKTAFGEGSGGFITEGKNELK